MSFKFNFGDENDNKNNQSQSLENDVDWLESEEINVNNEIISTIDEKIIRANMFICGELEIGHIVTSNLLQNMKNECNHVCELIGKENSDLISGKYEGGLKIWECTTDLIKYLMENELDIPLKNVKVLDLGCGVGILGVYAFLKGANVTFQDYNKEVLEHVTIPNVLLNIEDENQRMEGIQRCRFFCGDWSSFNEKLEEDMIYDFIFTSETIYNEWNYEKLVKIFSERLSDSGTVYVAAKTCYFGVGGGLRQFELALNKSDTFKHQVCWKTVDGIQREILKIVRKKYYYNFILTVP